jgi:hypothetical protein
MKRASTQPVVGPPPCRGGHLGHLNRNAGFFPRWVQALSQVPPQALAVILGILGLAALAQPAAAQSIKAYDTYEDAVDLGFKVKVPKDWNFIPPQPGDKNLIGKYDPKNDKGIDYKDPRYYWGFHVWLVKFDRRKKAGAAKPKDGEPRFEAPELKNVHEFVRGNETGLPGNWKKVEKEGGPLQIQGVPASWSVYELVKNEVPLRLYVAEYKLSDDLEIALVANAPGDPKKWQKAEGALQTMGRSFRRVELEVLAGSGAREGDSVFRTNKRAKLEAQVKSQPGWALHETGNYFIISNNPDKEFIEELKMRLEAIRKSYEETYPPERVLALKQKREEAQAKRKAEGGDKPEPRPEGGDGAPPTQEPGPEAEPPQEGRSVAAKATPLEMSRCSVVRVVQNRDQYASYGGPPQSAGYWNFVDEELVLFDDKELGGRRNTWAVLNHEAFHQYIFYFFGNLSPHSWYNEGTGDFYSGYQYKNGRFELKPFDWRVSTIKEALRQRENGKQTYIPLKELVRYTQAEYYGRNKYGIDGGDNYAQGWSFVWFLRTGAKGSRAWNKAWAPILDTYLEALALTDDLDQAVDQAFAGVDFEELEKAWIDYTLAL